MSEAAQRFFFFGGHPGEFLSSLPLLVRAPRCCCYTHARARPTMHTTLTLIQHGLVDPEPVTLGDLDLGVGRGSHGGGGGEGDRGGGRRLGGGGGRLRAHGAHGGQTQRWRCRPGGQAGRAGRQDGGPVGERCEQKR